MPIRLQSLKKDVLRANRAINIQPLRGWGMAFKPFVRAYLGIYPEGSIRALSLTSSLRNPVASFPSESRRLPHFGILMPPAPRDNPHRLPHYGINPEVLANECHEWHRGRVGFSGGGINTRAAASLGRCLKRTLVECVIRNLLLETSLKQNLPLHKLSYRRPFRLYRGI